MFHADFSYTLRLKIYKDEKFFGAGVAILLEHVDETHSLLQASKKMSMAYTKALKIIKRAETALGYKLLIRKSGGVDGGGSYLTPNAINLLKAYRKFESNVLAYSDTQFKFFLDKMGELK